MAVRTIDDRFINWSETGEAITDEVHTPDASEYNLRHDAWSALTIYTGAGETGTQLVLDTDYQVDTARTLTNAFGDTISVNTAVQIINATYQDTALYHNYTAHADFQKAINMVLTRAGAPEHYSRRGRWKIKGNDTATNRVTIVSPEQVEVEINGWGYWLPTQVEFRVDQVANWDTDTPTDYTIASNRAGKDFYIYAVEPESGYVPSFILSANATFPSGYTADTSRKVAGFHALCADILTNTYAYYNEGKDADYLSEALVTSTIATGDTSHWLSGYEEGDILHFSVWDLLHKPNSSADVEGRTFDPGKNRWVMIYLPSWDAGAEKLVSTNGGTIADGSSSPAFHQYRFAQVLGRQGEMNPNQEEFVSLSLGSPQGVNISGSADPITTGGHTATDGKRIVSNIGVEDATGVLWQWGRESGQGGSSSWANAYDGNDKNVAGQHYLAPNRPQFGSDWSGGAECGSRGALWNSAALVLDGNVGARGVAEPYGGRA
jgi:hypothetical protein